jgi:hypothetical protein
VAIAQLGNQPVDAITTGDLDQMVDALLRERDEIRKAREAGVPLMETVPVRLVLRAQALTARAGPINPVRPP